MLLSGAPTKTTVPFATSGTKNTIPIAASPTPGLASYTTGFPPLTMTAVAAGGIPPAGQDFNGILNAISAAIQYFCAGFEYQYDSAFASAVGGYPQGAMVTSANGVGSWRNTTDGNTANPDTGGAGWVPAFPIGVAGMVRSLSMSVAAASATATMTADQIVVYSALNGQSYFIPSFNKTINLATTGAGGMDTGAAPTSGFVAIYVIYNPVTQASALLGVAQGGSTFPNIYGGANMPAGYTASALVSVCPTNASKLFPILYQADRRLAFAPINAFTVTANSTGLGPANIGACVPLNARSCSGAVSGSSTAAANFTLSIAANPSNVGGQGFAGTASTASQSVGAPFQDMLLTLGAGLYYNFSASSGTPSMSLSISAYSF